jgi:hypothetical protein
MIIQQIYIGCRSQVVQQIYRWLVQLDGYNCTGGVPCISRGYALIILEKQNIYAVYKKRYQENKISSTLFLIPHTKNVPDNILGIL